MVSDANFWKTEADVAAMVYRMHDQFRYCFGGVTARVYRDRGLPFDYKGALFANISRNELRKSWTLTSPEISWQEEYTVVSKANEVIANAGRAPMGEDRLAFYLGQAYVVRAWTYFYILKTWGDAPLVKDAFETGALARSPWQEIADFAIADLQKAAALLPPAGELKDMHGNPVASKQFASRGTAFAILAHVYAWKAALGNEPGLRKEAIRAAGEVIGSGDYRMADTYREVCENVLRGNSPEGIFELDFYDLAGEEGSVGSCLAYFFEWWPVFRNTTPANPRNHLRLSFGKALELFPDPADERRREVFYALDSTRALPYSVTQGAAYFRKFRHVLYHESGWMAGRPRIFDQNEILLRLPDIILLRAEMKGLEGDAAGAVADLNTVRSRSGAALYSPSEGSLKYAIYRERLKELLGEGLQAHLHDVIRMGLDREVLEGDFKSPGDPLKLYLPVGIEAARFNPLMEQNPAWAADGFAF